MNKAEEKYNKETGMFATNADGCFTEDYNDWLEEMVEKQLTLTDVSKRFKVDPNKVIKTEPKMIKEGGFSLFG